MDLEARLQKLERQVSTYRTIGTLGVLAVAAWVGIAAVSPKPAQKAIRAQSFIVVDGQGKEMGLLSSTKEGATVFIGNDNGGIMMAAQRRGPFLALQDGNKKARIALAVVDDEPLIYVTKQDGSSAWQAP